MGKQVLRYLKSNLPKEDWLHTLQDLVQNDNGRTLFKTENDFSGHQASSRVWSLFKWPNVWQGTGLHYHEPNPKLNTASRQFIENLSPSRLTWVCFPNTQPCYTFQFIGSASPHWWLSDNQRHLLGASWRQRKMVSSVSYHKGSLKQLSTSVVTAERMPLPVQIAGRAQHDHHQPFETKRVSALPSAGSTLGS